MPPTITRAIAVDVPEDKDLGPKMRALTPRRRAFVVACLELGSVNHKRAAAMAGFSGNDATLAVYGHKLAHTLEVQEAMHEEAGRRLHSAKIMAVSQLLNIAEHSTDDKTRLKAIGMILNRTGMHEKTEHHVKTEDVSKTDEAMIERIRRLATELGLDAQKLLGNKGSTEPVIIDAEYTVASPDPVDVEHFPPDADDLFAPITEKEASHD